MIMIRDTQVFTLLCKKDVRALTNSVIADDDESKMTLLVNYMYKNAANVGKVLRVAEFVPLVRALGTHQSKPNTLLQTILCDVAAPHFQIACFSDGLVDELVRMVTSNGWMSVGPTIDAFVAALRIRSENTVAFRAHLALRLHEVTGDSSITHVMHVAADVVDAFATGTAAGRTIASTRTVGAVFRGGTPAVFECLVTWAQTAQEADIQAVVTHIPTDLTPGPAKECEGQVIKLLASATARARFARAKAVVDHLVAGKPITATLAPQSSYYPYRQKAAAPSIVSKDSVTDLFNVACPEMLTRLVVWAQTAQEVDIQAVVTHIPTDLTPGPAKECEGQVIKLLASAKVRARFARAKAVVDHLVAGKPITATLAPQSSSYPHQQKAAAPSIVSKDSVADLFNVACPEMLDRLVVWAKFATDLILKEFLALLPLEIPSKVAASTVSILRKIFGVKHHLALVAQEATLAKATRNGVPTFSWALPATANMVNLPWDMRTFLCGQLQRTTIRVGGGIANARGIASRLVGVQATASGGGSGAKVTLVKTKTQFNASVVEHHRKVSELLKVRDEISHIEQASAASSAAAASTGIGGGVTRVIGQQGGSSSKKRRFDDDDDPEVIVIDD
jgi:hypothetical protein